MILPYYWQSQLVSQSITNIRSRQTVIVNLHQLSVEWMGMQHYSAHHVRWPLYYLIA